MGQSIEVLGKPENLAWLVHVNAAIRISKPETKVLAKAVAAQLIHSLRMQFAQKNDPRREERSRFGFGGSSLSAGIAL